MGFGTPPEILALSPGDLVQRGVDRFVVTVARAVAAGLRGVVLREPGLEDGATLALTLRCPPLRENVRLLPMNNPS